MLKAVLQNLINLFFPETCPGCECLLGNGEYVLCTACRHGIPQTGHHLLPDNEAAAKFYGRLPIRHASAFCYFHKKGIVQKMIHKLKYKGHEKIGTALAYWYAYDLKQLETLADVGMILPVPLHPRRLRQRGYNQVTAFGKALAHGMGTDYNDTLLVRRGYSKTQTKKNLLARAISAKTVFDITSTEGFHDMHFLLVDDVITTGSTLEACGRALLKIPGARVSIVCVAMSHS